MLKFLRTKISSYAKSQQDREKLMQLSKKLVYAWKEQDFTETLKSIETACPEFHEYIGKNWINCKKSWCNYELKDLFTMCNNTTNRIEAHHRVPKLHLKSSASFCWNLEKLLIIIHHYRHVDTHVDFLEMCVTIDITESSPVLQPFFQYCTAYSAHKIVQEYKKASAKKYQITESGNFYKVCGTFTYEVFVSFTSCTCHFSLPCIFLVVICFS